MMKRLFFGLLIPALLIACGNEKRENYTTLDEDGNIVISDESITILEEIQSDYECSHVNGRCLGANWDCDKSR